MKISCSFGKDLQTKINLKLNIMKKIYLLFQTDLHQTTSSRVFFGAFSSKNLAVKAAKENDLYHYTAEVVILETTLNEFYEQ